MESRRERRVRKRGVINTTEAQWGRVTESKKRGET